VIPFGEAHGMVTLNSGHVLIHGRRVRILGAPHVEHTRLDLTDVPDAVVGDEVIVIGTQGNTEISRREVMSYQGMGREVALALQVRDSVARQYRRQ
jgi:alanine racemase